MGCEIIVTLGPSILNAEKLAALGGLANCIFRINGAHVDPDSARRIIHDVRLNMPDARIMLDLPGNKVRTTGITVPLPLQKGCELLLFDHQVNYPPFFQLLKQGQLIWADDSNLTLEVLETSPSNLRLLSRSNGALRNNKGLHARGVHDAIPFILDKDRRLMSVAVEERLAFVSLSYVRNAADVQEARALLGASPTTECFVKIETASAVAHLDELLPAARHFNIDRGDLAADIGLLNVPEAQRRVVQAALATHKTVFLATQFLKNMETHPVPLISEISALAEAFACGIHGVQLSEETAIGDYPVECIRLVVDVHRKYAKTWT